MLPDDEVMAPLRLRVAIDGRKVDLVADAPRGPVRAVRALPVLHALTDAVVARGVTRAKNAGRIISCGPKCGACCRQLVPISETEARAIVDLVEDLPAPASKRLRARFAEVERAATAVGLFERTLRPDTLPTEDLDAVGRAWFAMQTPCPFLEDESCAIHPVRPSVCREYLVTSPASACATPTAETIARVSTTADVSDAMNAEDAATAQRQRGWVPLGLALRWVEMHDREPEPRPVLDYVNGVLARLA